MLGSYGEGIIVAATSDKMEKLLIVSQHAFRIGAVRFGGFVPRVGHAADFDDRAVRAGVDAVIAAVGVGLQKAFEVFEELGRSIAGVGDGVVEDDARMAGTARRTLPRSGLARTRAAS
jgi:hypothetical protein